ncbi:MAG: A24 family peptidase C-terminal domain-containing protein [Candidatus ainarchaeum sp.]|nr:A24 family peptidase C-terminal domain-containing protein [Candidatus ainarchaeum sp.]
MFPFPFLFFLISIVFLAIASYTDLKARIVPNKLNYGILAVGIAGHAVWAFFANDAMILVFCIAATAIAFAFSYALWKIGVWAGGDVKLITALSALNPINPAAIGIFALTGIGLFGAVQLPVFPFSIFVFSVFSMAPYAAFVSAQRLLKNKEAKKEFVVDFKKKLFSTIEFSMAIIGIGAVLLFFGLPLLIDLPLIFVFSLIRKKIFRVAIAIALFGFALWKSISDAQWLAWLVLLFMGAWLLFKLYSLSKKLMRKKIGIDSLEEGMIPAETLVENNGKIEKAPDFEIKKIINHLMHNRLRELNSMLSPKGKIIISSARAAGLEEEEIRELKKLAKEKKIGQEISIRESVALVPAILIGYILLNIFGDVIWNMLFAI